MVITAVYLKDVFVRPSVTEISSLCNKSLFCSTYSDRAFSIQLEIVLILSMYIYIYNKIVILCKAE